MPHIEMTREIARKFNRQYAEVFPEPRGLTGASPGSWAPTTGAR